MTRRKTVKVKAIVITERTHAMIRGMAKGPMLETGKRRADGRWVVPVADDVYQALQDMNMDVDIAIRRMAVAYAKRQIEQIKQSGEPIVPPTDRD